jgi:hypothetical protein
MKKKQSRKPRTPSVSLAFEKEVSIELSPPSPDGRIYFTDSATGERILPTTVITSQTYERQKGRKILYQANQDPADIHLDPNENLCSFKTIFAIDTNTDPNTCTSISVSLLLHNIGKNAEGAWSFSAGFPQAFIFNSRGKDPERFAWHVLLLGILQSPDVKKPIAIIVDSHLNAISEINGRKQVVNEDFFLPPEISLLYASADTGGEFIPNAAIKVCDCMATKIARSGIPLTDNKGFQFFRIPESMIAEG